MDKTKEIDRLYAALPTKLLLWYNVNARTLPWRENTDPYRIWVSEIMLQQTRVEAVIGYYNRFLAALPDLHALADCDPDRLLKLWEGLGYYSRAKNLQKAAQVIVNEFGGVFPDTVADIEKLPGIGPYTAGAVASICFERAAAAVDGNVLRIVARIMGDDTPIDNAAFKKEIAVRLTAVYPAQGQRGAFTQALMELGATVCTPKSPRCAGCPMTADCVALRTGRVDVLPVMPARKPKKRELRTVFLLECGGRLALAKRPDKGLLAGLWGLPDADGTLDETAALDMVLAWGVQPVDIVSVTRKQHIFTHIVWEMTGYRFRCAQPNTRFVWADADELSGKYALPTAYRVFLD